MCWGQMVNEPFNVNLLFFWDLDGIEDPHPDGFTSSYHGMQDTIKVRVIKKAAIKLVSFVLWTHTGMKEVIWQFKKLKHKMLF